MKKLFTSKWTWLILAFVVGIVIFFFLTKDRLYEEKYVNI